MYNIKRLFTDPEFDFARHYAEIAKTMLLINLYANL